MHTNKDSVFLSFVLTIMSSISIQSYKFLDSFMKVKNSVGCRIQLSYIRIQVEKFDLRSDTLNFIQ